MLSQSYYPEEERKSKFSIWLDNLLWVIKNNEVNKLYYAYGMDRKAGLNGLEVMSLKKFGYIRDKENLFPAISNYSYICILRDKFIFSQLLKSLDIPTPTNLALLNKEGVTWLADMRQTPLEYLVENESLNIKGFSKELAGILGKGAFPLQVAHGKLYIKNEEVTVDQLRDKVDGLYLLQEHIDQHPQMNYLYPSAVNTIRVVTFFINGKVEVFCASLRIGAKGRSVDNWAAGGIVVGVDMKTGNLTGEGLFKPGYGGRVTNHPDTGVKLDGFQIPFFHEGVKKVCELHSYLYGIHSVGWDVAITPNGPTIIEGNDNWDGGIPMSLEKNFKSRFLSYYSK